MIFCHNMSVSWDHRQELVQALNRARLDRHVSIREAARIAGVPTATVQGWLQGRYFPTPALRKEFTTLVQSLGLADRLTPQLWSTGDRPRDPSHDGTSRLGHSVERLPDALFVGPSAIHDVIEGLKTVLDASAQLIVIVVAPTSEGSPIALQGGEGWVPRVVTSESHGSEEMLVGSARSS